MANTSTATYPSLVKWTATLAFAVVFATACGDKTSIFHKPGPMKPGDPEYPVLNPNAAHRVRLVVSGLELVDARLFAHYTTIPPDATRCGEQIGLGGFFPEGIVDPIVLSPPDSRSERVGWVVIDKYFPGDCRWHLLLVGYEVGHHQADEPDQQLISYTDRIDYRNPTSYHWDFWCYKPIKEMLTSNPVCTSLAELLYPQGYQRHATKQFASHFTEVQQGRFSLGPFDPTAQELRVEFHDIEAIPGALVPLRYCGESPSVIPCADGDTNFAK